LAIEWPLKLHDRGELTIMVVNPFWLDAALAPTRDDAERQAKTILRPLLLKPFDSSAAIDVVQKKQNTQAFLDYAIHQTITQWTAIREAGIGKEPSDA
jgi:hypothetical protein